MVKVWEIYDLNGNVMGYEEYQGDEDEDNAVMAWSDDHLKAQLIERKVK